MIPKFEKKAFHYFLELGETNSLIYNTLHFDQYSLLAIRFNIFGFQPIIRNFKKAFHYFVELVETNPLMYNIKDLG